MEFPAEVERHLRDKMKKLRVESDRLAGEIKERADRQRAIEAQIEAIETLIGKDGQPRPDERQPARASNRIQLSLDDIETTATAAVEAATLINAGIRDAIRIALQDIGRPSKPAVVTRWLKQHDYKPEGKTDLSTRVSNEVWRMNKAGQLKKTDRGYWLADA